MARWAEVGYLRRLVEFGPHTVAHEVPHDGATVCFHVLLHRVGDIIDPVAGAGELDALPEALFGHMDQMHGLVAHLSAGEGGGAWNPPMKAPTSTLTMSPSFSFRGPGIPWMTSSLIEIQAEPGKPL